MRLSIRELEVMEAIERCGSVGLVTLEGYFESRFPADELRVVVTCLKRKGLVSGVPAQRTEALSLTRAGNRSLEEAHP